MPSCLFNVFKICLLVLISCLFVPRSMPHLSSPCSALQESMFPLSAGFQAGLAVEALLEDWKEGRGQVPGYFSLPCSASDSTSPMLVLPWGSPAYASQLYHNSSSQQVALASGSDNSISSLCPFSLGVTVTSCFCKPLDCFIFLS